MSKKIVLASNNKKKMKEMQELLAPMSAEVISQGSLGIPSAEEPFGTFVEMRWQKPDGQRSIPVFRPLPMTREFARMP